MKLIDFKIGRIYRLLNHHDGAQIGLFCPSKSLINISKIENVRNISQEIDNKREVAADEDWFFLNDDKGQRIDMTPDRTFVVLDKFKNYTSFVLKILCEGRIGYIFWDVPLSQQHESYSNIAFEEIT